jgi:hypothetical protein
MVHGEERHAKVPRVLLVPPQLGEGDAGLALGQGPHDAVLRGEVGVEEEEMLGGRHAHDQSLLGGAVPGVGADTAHDGLVGEAVRLRRLHVEDLDPGAAAGPALFRLLRQPLGEYGGNLTRVSMIDIGHGAGV